MKRLPALLFLCLTLGALAAGKPYDEKADAHLDIQRAMAQAATNRTPILLVFGANWCGDCRMLDKAMKTGAAAPRLSHDFTVVKVDVGQFDKNQDVAKTYGVPLEKGIPAVAIVTAKGEVLYVTRHGELADARQMGDKGVYDFFERVTAEALAKK